MFKLLLKKYTTYELRITNYGLRIFHNKLKVTGYGLLLIISLLLTSCSYNPNISYNPAFNDSTKITFNSSEKKLTTIKAYIADTDKERQQGLRQIKYLPENEGMIFNFPEPQYVTFVMEHVNIPLDIIFIDKNKKIIDIKNAEACTKTDAECGFYKSPDMVKFVIEVNKGYTAKNGIIIGNFVKIR